MTHVAKRNETPGFMNEEELKSELKGSLLLLTTSSPDKRVQYKRLFTSLDKKNKTAGIDAFIADSGAFGIAPTKTPEKTGNYQGNLDEKALLQLGMLREKSVTQAIRSRLGANDFDATHINIMGMTEDSGWEIAFDSPDQKQNFIHEIKIIVAPLLRTRDQWLLDKLDYNGFPGPNLKPLQEHLGGFNHLMEIIYDAAHRVGMEELRFRNHVSVSFTSPRMNKIFTKDFQTKGTFLTREQYAGKLITIGRGEAINSDFVHIPDGQAPGENKTIDVMKSDLLTTSSQQLPAEYVRRDMTEWLQQLIGKRRASRDERERSVHIAFASPQSMEGSTSQDISMPVINDLTISSVPTNDMLRKHPNRKPLNGADVVVLTPDTTKRDKEVGASDPNLRLVLSFLVTVETDPESMRVPIVLDNRTGYFDSVLDVMRDAFAHGRLMGDSPLLVANTDAELRSMLVDIKTMRQREPVIQSTERKRIEKSAPVQQVPRDDGIFTLFIGGGHANNSKRDLEDAHDFGYYCAARNWRIVTGAGCVEGSMGATHTGFIQYHLDQLEHAAVPDAVREQLRACDVDGKYDAESMILKNPELLEALADQGFIPRDMFYGYSMENLLKMESPSGKAPPAITYCEAGNRVRRLEGLLAPGTKVFLPGSIGTDEEFEHALKMHLDARGKKKASDTANDIAFADGTRDDDGAMIVYNRDGHLDALLAHYKLLGNGASARAARDIYNITIIDNSKQLKDATNKRATSWLNRVAAGGVAEGMSRLAA